MTISLKDGTITDTNNSRIYHRYYETPKQLLPTQSPTSI